MASSRSKAVTFAALVCLASPADSSQTFFGEVLIDWNHVWKYEPSNTNLAPYLWTTAEYPDSTWISGPGILAFPPSELLPPGRSNLTVLTRAEGQLTVYFRAAFTWDRPEPVFLTFSNLIDDGAVFYLNGAEIRRVRIRDGPVEHSTLATIGHEVIQGDDVFIVENPPLVRGVNILAVEVHQSTAASGDVVFGCSVRADQTRPPCGWQPPIQRALTLRVCSSSLLSVPTAGLPAPMLQWHKDGIPIPGATNATYSLTQINPADQGAYVCTESNALGVCDLGVFTIAVVVDEGLLYVEEAVGLLDLTQIKVRFSLPVQRADAEELFNYQLDGLEIQSVRLSDDGREALLTTEARARGQFYQLQVSSIDSAADACGSLVVPLPDSSRLIDLETLLLPFNTVWNYQDAGADLGTAWREPAYDDSLWPSGPALLGVESTPTTLQELQTQGLFLLTPLSLSQGPGGLFPTTYYFRARVDVPELAVSRLVFHHVVDDGAVVFVNGTEAGRFNVPSGFIGYSTLAVTTPPEGVIRSMPVSGFTRGTNLLAVEVHQTSNTGGDALFGAQLTGIVSASSAGQLRLQRDAATGGFILSWRGSATLEETSTFPPHWSRAADQANPQTNSLSTAARFYRLRW